MKKQYIKPTVEAFTANATAILAGSDSQSVSYGGPNIGITAAEGKDGSFYDDWE